MITKRPGRPGKVKVTFALPASIWADRITLVGDFNDWDTEATPLRQLETGWMVTLDLEAGQEYHYRYVHNGSEWHNDWHADAYARNAYGGDDSVVITPAFVAPLDPDHDPNSHEALGSPRPAYPPRLRLVKTG